MSLSSIPDIFRQALVAHQQGDTADAETLSQEILRLDPDNVDAHYLIGAILLDKGNAAGALPHLQHALQSKPTYPGILYALGNTYFALEQWQLAASTYQALHSQGHVSALTLINLATSFINLKMFRLRLISCGKP